MPLVEKNENTLPLLEVEELVVQFRNKTDEWTSVVDEISFSLHSGVSLGILGESGSGKSMTLYSCAGLSTYLGARVSFKKFQYRMGKENIFSYANSEEEPWVVSGIKPKNDPWKKLRGSEIGFVFQDAGASLHPLLTVEQQIREGLKTKSKKVTKEEVLRLLKSVQIKDPETVAGLRINALSGGMKQRVMIACALAGKPRVLFADEPSSAIDFSSQLAVIQLLKDLQKEYALSLIVVSHDLHFLAALCDELIVMKQGKIVDRGLARTLLENPQHPYTKELVELSR